MNLSFFRKNWFYIIAWIIFLSLRIYILIHYPQDYSDVKYDYERYANMWWYGLPPYLKHLFEYPPATIPLLIIPLALDLAGIGIYYFNYRIIIFLLEIIIYIFIVKYLAKQYYNSPLKYGSLLIYNLSALICKNYWYDGIDLVFAGSLTIALVIIFLYKKPTLFNKIIFWSFFWLSVAIKIVTLPLLVPFLLIKRSDFLEEAKAAIIGFLIIWGLPLIIFRSSLSVFLYFHAVRPLHASSFPAFIVYTLNHFTHSETMRNLEWFGPLSQKALFWSFIFLAFNTGWIIVWSVQKLRSNKSINRFVLMLKTSIIYLIVFMLSGKIFSTPFNIWYILLLTIFPYKSFREQITYILLISWSLIFNTTNIFNNIPQIMMIYPFTWNYLRHVWRFPPLIFLVLLTMKNMGIKLSSNRSKLPNRLAK